MNTAALHRLGYSLAVSGAALLAACADNAPVGPFGPATTPNDRENGAELGVAVAASRSDSRTPDLSACPKLEAPRGSKLAFHVYAKGVQKYHWNGTGWSFDGPEATLSADAAGKSIVGTHYAGPKWESNSGGTVRGTVLETCSVDPNAIAWLLLSAVSEGPGIFHRVTHIQRVNTAGGKAPGYSGQMGEAVRIPYTTEYLFYRAQ
jgi:hypothetical protein